MDSRYKCTLLRHRAVCAATARLLYSCTNILPPLSPVTHSLLAFTFPSQTYKYSLQQNFRFPFDFAGPGCNNVAATACLYSLLTHNDSRRGVPGNIMSPCIADRPKHYRGGSEILRFKPNAQFTPNFAPLKSSDMLALYK